MTSTSKRSVGSLEIRVALKTHLTDQLPCTNCITGVSARPSHDGLGRYLRIKETREATELYGPAGLPVHYMQAAAVVARELDPTPYAVDFKPQLIYELRLRNMAEAMRVYQNVAQYNARFSDVELRRFAFSEIPRNGDSRSAH